LLLNIMQPPDSPQGKGVLRHEFRSRRQAQSNAARAGMDERIRGHLASAIARGSVREVAAFLAFDAEPDLLPLLRQWHEQGVRLALPVVPRDGGRLLSLHAWQPDEQLAENSFGIREPHAGPARDVSKLDLLLIPLVSFDAHGTRLGMGAGYYDRLLAPVRASERPLRVGVAYACQRAERLPREPWDVPLHAVVTEDGWFSCPA